MRLTWLVALACAASLTLGAVGGWVAQGQRVAACHRVVAGYRDALTEVGRAVTSNNQSDTFAAGRAAGQVKTSENRCGLPDTDRYHT
jgi:hypothetical protein